MAVTVGRDAPLQELKKPDSLKKVTKDLGTIAEARASTGFDLTGDSSRPSLTWHPFGGVQKLPDKNH